MTLVNIFRLKLATAMLLLTATALPAVADFERVEIIMPMYSSPCQQPLAREITDIVQIGVFNQVGMAPDAEQLALLKEVRDAWPEKEIMVRTRVSMPAYLDGQEPNQVKFGAVSNPAENLYDFADADMRQRVSQALYRTIKDIPTADWVWMDEPNWGYAGVVDPRKLQISDSLQQATLTGYGKKIESVQAFVDAPATWYAFVRARNRAMTDTIVSQCKAMQRAGKKSSVNFIPAALESTAVTAVDIPDVMARIPDAIDTIQIDPYYTLFVDNPRFAGFMLRLLDDVTSEKIPMAGWIDSVNGIKERLAIKCPPAISMKTQVANYLANGCDDLAVWHYVTLERLNNLDAFAKMVRWIRKHQFLFNGNPRNVSPVGLYFSNSTFYLHDFFPPAWSHGLGSFGQYYDVVHTYYNTVCSQNQVRVITPALGAGPDLDSNLAQLNTIILVDAVVISDAERRAFDRWVRAGGTLIAVGRCGLRNEIGSKTKGLQNISGVTYTSSRPRKGIKLTDDCPFANKGGKTISIDGSSHNLYVASYRSNLDYIKQHGLSYDYAAKWPLYARNTVLGKATGHQDPKPGLLGEPTAVGFNLPEKAEIWATYLDGKPAIASVAAGRGRVVHVGPVDLFSNDLDASCRHLVSELIRQNSSPTIHLNAATADLASVELSVLKKKTDGEDWLICHLLNHVEDDQHIIAPTDPLSAIQLDYDLPADTKVADVLAFSPDAAEVSMTYKADDGKLRVNLKQLNVYTVILIKLSTI